VRKCLRLNDLWIFRQMARALVGGPQDRVDGRRAEQKKALPLLGPTFSLLFHYSGQLEKKRFMARITAVGQVSVTSADMQM